MIFLLVSYRVYLSHDFWEIMKPQYSRADILGHINGGAVGSQQHFLIEAVSREVNPYGTVFFFKEHALLDTAHHFFPTQQISIGLIIKLIKINAHFFVSG